jgi:F-type H+-transporting ATPase subunit a
MGPILILSPAFLILETISLLVRPVSLTVRLGVNISVDHLLQGIARTLGDTFLGVVGAATLPVPLYFLGLLVCVVQAFVFALLTTIYVSLSVAHADEHHH